MSSSAMSPLEPDSDERVRLDKWLWAARFYKTRALAAEQIARGRVLVNGAPAKASRAPRPGDTIQLRIGDLTRTVVVRALSRVRGPAAQAALLYEETAESIAARLQQAERQRLAPEPASSITRGRPTKRDRRQLQAWHERAAPPPWDARWSARASD
jgi:ribosome-associated heat shock protein Hsp15